jgi:hypothetical protein
MKVNAMSSGCRLARSRRIARMDDEITKLASRAADLRTIR